MADGSWTARSPSLKALPEVVEAVGGQMEILMDGGVPGGGHCQGDLPGCARGADRTHAYAYGLTAAGEAGVTRALKVLKDDLDLTLTLLGMPVEYDQLDASYLVAEGQRGSPFLMGRILAPLTPQCCSVSEQCGRGRPHNSRPGGQPLRAATSHFFLTEQYRPLTPFQEFRNQVCYLHRCSLFPSAHRSLRRPRAKS